MTEEDVKAILPGAAVFRSGSREICQPSPSNTDEDWIVFTKRPHTACLREADFVKDGPTRYANGPFQSYRRGETNLIVTRSLTYFLRFRAATVLAKELNLTNKPARVGLFNVITGQEILSEELELLL